MDKGKNKAEESSEQPKQLFGLHVLNFDRRVQPRFDLDEIIKHFKSEIDSGIEKDLLEPVYIVPTTFEIDATNQYIGGNTPMQGSAAPFSYAILKESEVSSKFPSLRAVGKADEWKMLFGQVVKEKNPDEFPIMIMSVPAHLQAIFTYIIANDIIRDTIKMIKNSPKQ